jgi:hypothetical protein
VCEDLLEKFKKPIPDCEQCPVKTLLLYPCNEEAWQVYQLVQDQITNLHPMAEKPVYVLRLEAVEAAMNMIGVVDRVRCAAQVKILHDIATRQK